jgi:hypothetical protein
VKRPLGLLQDEPVGTTNKNGGGLARVLDSSNLNDSRARERNLLDKISISELVLGEVGNISNRLASSTLSVQIEKTIT